MRAFSLSAAAALLATANAGTVIWDGRFNDLSTSADLATWSWSNQVGPYQYYIHGSGSVTEYVNLSPSYKNPADTSSKQGAKVTLTNTAYWNGQNMRRTELIPQTSAAINQGKVWYHFSMMTSGTNYPSIYREHQINFFESHFTEMKSGWISGEAATSNPNLQWMVGGVSKWSTNFTAGVWHNVAYEIDFSANTVGFWHSTGSDPLELTVSPVSASTSSNGADWHLGVLELPRSGYSDSNEDFYFSGVYVESGSLTTTIGSGGELSWRWLLLVCAIQHRCVHQEHDLGRVHDFEGADGQHRLFRVRDGHQSWLHRCQVGPVRRYQLDRLHCL
ncbi:putative carbohydrate-binding module family 1 protein [Diaporthe ampelina]|uniref:Putative carbohydrate-binding module family 1 protein n=1 Tax=Diaporthe ampelina TaxID=1214573 RepID=A0A0G2FIL2_9PEZI|nr:putative carbohydrate-binding module family 1 protein [Diaporthe ampelina]